MKETLHMETELGLIRSIFYKNLRNVKSEIECLIPQKFHNQKDDLGSSFFRVYYTEYIKDVNKANFAIYLQKAEAIEQDYLKTIKDIYAKILTITDCQCTPQSVQKLLEECNLLNHYEKWNIIKEKCFSRPDLLQMKSKLAPKFK